VFARYHLHFLDDGSRDPAARIHRARNFAEELHYTLKERDWGTTSDPNTMTDYLLISIPHKKHHRDSMSLLAHLMAKHMMESEIDVKPVQGGSA
jgi:hypothetical protein